MSDPWLDQSTKKDPNISTQGATNDIVVVVNTEDIGGFEDNFSPTASNASPRSNAARSNCNTHQPLPDSATYLQGLERKLQKIKKSTKLVEALAEKRDDSLRSFLQEDSTQNNNVTLELDAAVSNGDSTVQEIYRHLQPIQPITVGETVHIVKHDLLDQEKQEGEAEADAVSATKAGVE